MELWLDDHKRLHEFLDILEKEEDCVNFMAPVPWKEWGLIDYPKIVKRPMDLTTVWDNLKNGFFKTIEAFIDDINLVW